MEAAFRLPPAAATQIACDDRGDHLRTMTSRKPGTAFPIPGPPVLKYTTLYSMKSRSPSALKRPVQFRKMDNMLSLLKTEHQEMQHISNCPCHMSGVRHMCLYSWQYFQLQHESKAHACISGQVWIPHGVVGAWGRGRNAPACEDQPTPPAASGCATMSMLLSPQMLLVRQ